MELRYVGKVTADEFRETAGTGLNLAKENNTKLFLIDESRWEGDVSVSDMYDLIKFFDELGFERGGRDAIILPLSSTSGEDIARFCETICLNRGWKIKLFTDRQEAIDWLLNE